MTVHGADFEIRTRGENHILDITGEVTKAISSSKLQDGIASVFVAGSTGAITTLEFEPGLLEDIPAAMERLAPRDGEYQHHLRWQDGNGHSHVRAAILGPGITVPFRNGKMLLGTWQQIVFLEMDVKPRTRQIHVQIVGE
ncbi:MAG: secondary thiamine-phosphate synthase enzyme YjbQ [Thermoplasmata archaeon]|nr:secondary thiamine-phosphate synthase enzyme YjbQ [Thermoplasmata archaeon]